MATSAATLIEVRIDSATPLTEEITLFQLSRADGLALPRFTAGAHIAVHLAEGLVRPYSLCGHPDQSDHYLIAVKLEPSGRGGSQALHAHGIVGARLSIEPPCNLFPLAASAPHHLLLGAGIGLTPLISMAHTLHATGQSFSLVCFARSATQLAFATELEAMPWAANVVRQFDDQPSTRLELEALIERLPPASHLYCCGPQGFIAQARELAAQRPELHWHQESFAASLEPRSANEQAFELILSASDQRLTVPAGTSMVTALRGAGIEIDTVCEQGICGSCVTAWRDGEPIHRDECLDDQERCEYLALCCAGCRTATLTLEL